MSWALWMAALLLWILDASINISMEPFRAFVGDMLPDKQLTIGFAAQSFFIGIGAVISSILPYVLEKFGVSNEAVSGIPDTVKISFYAGAIVFILAITYTVFTTKEYSPEQMKAFGEFSEADVHSKNIKTPASVFIKRGLTWFSIGAVLSALLYLYNMNAVNKLRKNYMC